MNDEEILSLLEKIKTVRNSIRSYSPEDIEKLLLNKVILNLYDNIRRDTREIYASFLSVVSNIKDIDRNKLNYIKKKYELIDKGMDVNLLNISPQNYEEVFNIVEDILANIELLLCEVSENVCNR